MEPEGCVKLDKRCRDLSKAEERSLSSVQRIRGRNNCGGYSEYMEF